MCSVSSDTEEYVPKHDKSPLEHEEQKSVQSAVGTLKRLEHVPSQWRSIDIKPILSEFYACFKNVGLGY